MYKILVIEDEKGTSMPVKEALELHGYEASIAEDGATGIKMFKNDTYDLVLLDLKMPNMTGKEVLKKIRQMDPYVYVIIYTNYGEFEEVKELANIGIDGYINKGPASELQELIDKIKEKLDPLDEEDVKKLMGGIEELPIV